VYQEFLVSCEASFLCAGQDIHWKALYGIVSTIAFARTYHHTDHLMLWSNEACIEGALLTVNSLLDAKAAQTGELDIKHLLAHDAIWTPQTVVIKSTLSLGLRRKITQSYLTTPQ
jgi:hypothetical protein